jgi:META domain-containing protein
MDMRRYVVALAAAGLLVAGCAEQDSAGGPPIPDERISVTDPILLVGSWTLADVPDGTDSVIRLAGDVSVWRDCAILLGSWRGNEYGQFVAYVSSYSGDCGGAPATTPDWLSRSVAFGVDGEARVLLDAQGQVTARLLPGAEPTPGTNLAPELAEPPELTEDLTRALAPAVDLPADLTPAGSDALIGRWVPADGSSTSAETPYVELAADGSWQGSDGCNGQAGRWVAGPDGALLAVSGGSTMIGCDNVPVGGWLSAASRAGIEGDELVLLDAQGTELGRLRRA